VTVPKEIARGWPWPILNVLGKEMEHAGRLFKTSGVDPDFARRVMLRTLFSTLDAYAFVLSDRALSVAEHRGIEFSKGMLEVLREGKESRTRTETRSGSLSLMRLAYTSGPPSRRMRKPTEPSLLFRRATYLRSSRPWRRSGID
jgi:hypothetical protein